jgi:hypothetical protein
MRPMLSLPLAVSLALASFGSALAQTAPPPGAQPQQPPPPPPGYAYPPPGYAYPPPGYAYPPGYPPPGYPPTAYAPPVPAAPPVPEKKLGVGYKIGNGLGAVGADLIVAPVEHLAFDLQINYLSYSTSDGTATGTGFAPSVQGRLYGGQRSTPYVGFGWAHASLKLNDVSAAASGVFANLGYEWRWDSGFGLILGGGVVHIGAATATDGVTTISRQGGWSPNVEFGARFMFL